MPQEQRHFHIEFRMFAGGENLEGALVVIHLKNGIANRRIYG